MIRISIIIATYNASKYLKTALDSIVAQNYRHLNLILIDGNSTDNTVQIIREYEGHISYWVSERDNGIYDAWNKGVKKATGEWIMFLGSDDCLLPGALQAYSDFIAPVSNDVDFVSSKVNLTDINLIPYRVAGWPWEWPRFQHVNTIAHPGSMHSRRLFEKYGYFSTAYKICGDYEFLLRPRASLRAAFMNRVTVAFRTGGVSDGYAAIRESFYASRKTGHAPLVPMLLHAAIAFAKYFIRTNLLRLNIRVHGRQQSA